ncbi:MAG: hypothetical protein ACOX9A_13825 [Anaerolineae bacterium]|jgi:4-amino-4-deoxy-L-arabinose transferase-like glycosyltransferase
MPHTRTDRREKSIYRAALWLIIAVYLAIGTLYAIETPAWQVPDEPAHYNYVKFIAEHGRLPELQPGDYPADYLEEIKARRFPSDMSIEPIRYEAHQPPLYYLTAAFVYRLVDLLPGGRHLLALRLLSLLYGVGALATGCLLIRRLLPHAPLLALGTVAFAATLPMHIAMSAAVNSDSLAIWLLSSIVLVVVSPGTRRWTLRRTAALGLLLGLAFLTKMQSYVGFGVALAALAWDTLWPGDDRTAPNGRLALGRAALMLGVALAVASPWLLRNIQTYGLDDPLAMARHDTVVEGQLTTREFLATSGPMMLAWSLAQTTFRSFWGQFGWMGVVLDERIYRALFLVSTIAGGGLLLRIARAVRDWRRDRELFSAEMRRGLALLTLWLALTALGYLWWNVKFVQHQGRYLFPALVPIGLAFTVGLREALTRSAQPVAVALAVGALALLALGLVTGDIRAFTTAMLAAASMAIVAGALLERRWTGSTLALYYGGMAGFALICLYLYIVPWLTP